MKVFITGESHVGALKRGHDLLANSGNALDGMEVVITPLGGGHLIPTPFFSDKGEYVEIVNKEYRKRIRRLPFLEQEYDWYGLVAPLHSARVFRMTDWQMFSPLGEMGKIPVSKSLLRRIVQDDQRYVMQLIEVLQRIGVRLFVVEPPRPFRHHYATSLYGAETVYYVDRFYRTQMKEWLTSKEVPVIEVPSDSFDAEGFTLNEFRALDQKDQHHGSPAFGALMIERIIEFLNPGNLDFSSES